MVNLKIGEHEVDGSMRWEDVFDQIREDSPHDEIETAVVVAVCADGSPELFVTGKSSPDEVIAELHKLEAFIRSRCVADERGRLRWDVTSDGYCVTRSDGNVH